MLPDNEYIFTSEIKVYEQGEQDLYTSFPVPEVVEKHLFQDEVFAQTIWPDDYSSVESKIELYDHIKEIVKRFEKRAAPGSWYMSADEALDDVFYYFKKSLGK